MNEAQLKRRLRGIEWTDIEFKEASVAVPKSAFETVSAFANSAGGWLIFGIREEDGAFSIAGVVDPEKVHSDFVSSLRATSSFTKTMRTIRENQLSSSTVTLYAYGIPGMRSAGRETCCSPAKKRFATPGLPQHFGALLCANRRAPACA
jgi:ATP-dependent DNA helicase RecG